MIDWAVAKVPDKYLIDGIAWILVGVVAFGAGFATNLFYRERTITQVVHTHPSVTQLLGKPDQSVAGAQINQGLTGLTCDVYQARAVIYCHR